MPDDSFLNRAALCLEWAEPVGGIGPLRGGSASEGAAGGFQRLIGGLVGSPFPARPIDDDRAKRYAEAERLAGSIANIARPGLKVGWSTGGTARRDGEIYLDPAMLQERRGWDLPHRVDALMGVTLRDAAHAVRTPRGYREELAALNPDDESERARERESERTRNGGTEGRRDRERGRGVRGGEVGEGRARLLACFLLVEARHVTTWLSDTFPGFRGYDEAIWAWRIPRQEAARRLSALRGKHTFGVVLNAAVTLVVQRGALQNAPPGARELLVNIVHVLDPMGPATVPARRFDAALELHRLLRHLPSDQTQGDKQGQRVPSQKTSTETGEAPHEDGDGQVGLRGDDAEQRREALEAMTVIALNGLDPDAKREGLTPDALRRVRGFHANTQKKRGSGKDTETDPDADEFVQQQRVRFQGRRPMRLITPPVDAHARMLYDASFARMRPQIDALRRVLKFRLVERRFAQYAQSSGQLDEQALYRLAFDDTRVFLRKSVESAPDQDLCVLLDESASMGRGQQDVRATVVLFHHALRDLPGVRHWVFGFSGYGTSIALYRYLSPMQSTLQDPRRLGAIASREATPLGEAIAGAAEAMLAEGHGRERLMIVVTDGQPDDADGARRALRVAEARGISILGLGITADTVASAELFSHFTLYEDLATLPRKVGAILRRVVGTAP